MGGYEPAAPGKREEKREMKTAIHFWKKQLTRTREIRLLKRGSCGPADFGLQEAEGVFSRNPERRPPEARPEERQKEKKKKKESGQHPSPLLFAILEPRLVSEREYVCPL